MDERLHAIELEKTFQLGCSESVLLRQLFHPIDRHIFAELLQQLQPHRHRRRIDVDPQVKSSGKRGIERVRTIRSANQNTLEALQFV